MAPIDGTIWMKIDINLPLTIDVNISKGQPPRASGLGGVRFQRSKSPAIYYIYKTVALLSVEATSRLNG